MIIARRIPDAPASYSQRSFQEIIGILNNIFRDLASSQDIKASSLSIDRIAEFDSRMLVGDVYKKQSDGAWVLAIVQAEDLH